MSNLFFEIHKDEILNQFKSNFKNVILRKIQINPDELIQSTLGEFNIFKFEKKDISFLEEWFELIYNQSFIKEIILKNQNANEYIFHSQDSCQTISHKESTFQSLNEISREDFQLSIEILALKNNIAWNFNSPFMSFQIQLGQNNFRATLIHHSLSPNQQSKLFLRKHSQYDYSIDDFTEHESATFLVSQLLANKKNILISGSTGSGKTTLLKTLIQKLPKEEHIIILEDTYEIEIHAPQVTNLISDESHSNKSLKEYCTYALRMSPDRIILGEMRGHEVIPFLLAMNTGHSGLMSTIHANSAIDSIHRLNLLFGFFSGQTQINPEYITKLICQNIDYVIHMEKNKIKEILKVLGAFENTPMTEVIYQLSA